jgi:hypothetical protein
MQRWSPTIIIAALALMTAILVGMSIPLLPR